MTEKTIKTTQDLVDFVNAELGAKESNPLFTLTPHSIDGLACLAYLGHYTDTSVPAGDIFEETKQDYYFLMNDNMFPHRNRAFVEASMREFHRRWNEEVGFKELYTEPL